MIVTCGKHGSVYEFIMGPRLGCPGCAAEQDVKERIDVENRLESIANQLKEKFQMGNWHISIEGVGIHHNRNTPDDANRLAQHFVAEMKAHGHNITKASFTYGGADDLMTVDYATAYDDPPQFTTQQKGSTEG